MRISTGNYTTSERLPNELRVRCILNNRRIKQSLFDEYSLPTILSPIRLFENSLFVLEIIWDI